MGRERHLGEAVLQESVVEPPDHGIARSRGALTTKLHVVCDGRGRPSGLTQWRGIAMRSDELLRSFRAAVGPAAT